ncbi:glycosyltransferase family 10 [Rhizobium sp. AAP116]|uniref:glycosyltransferase family 10 domain-containing protein n=1 Tax=Rhizobium sp. AAP116 TaxID=1523429 RepID=UPI0006B97F50|nr:glycosyltransferase family 10 [Rhizobium sp. AAP116]
MAIYIDPSYPDYYGDKLFDIDDKRLNRDGTLLPFARLRAQLNLQGVDIHTFDSWKENSKIDKVDSYFSLGMLKNYRQLIGNNNIKLAGFIIMEPPAVAPRLYKALPEITKYFECVYLHNVHGDGYSLKGVDRSKLRKFYWPQPFNDVLQPSWSEEERLERIVVINGNHLPRSFSRELYSTRIAAMAALAPLQNVDLYGRGWSDWWSHRSMWPPYWMNYKKLMSVYRGACESKYDVLAKYKFSLCFENMAMEGYVTEKIFDCFYAGCVPLYLGATDINTLIPDDAYIDCRQFASWLDMDKYVKSISAKDINKIREAGKEFVNSKNYSLYYDSLLNITHSNY